MRPPLTALGLVLGVALDSDLGDPRRGHPVAGFGQVAGWVERAAWAPSRVRGTAYASGLVGGSAALGLGLQAATRTRPVLRVAATATSTWAVLGGASLRREGARIGADLVSGDLEAARRHLPALVGRDPSALDAAEIGRAVVESVAENTADAVVAPLVWGAVLGIPGLLAYRAANTLDAMVGHHSERYERFGWASARLDDVLNLAPARLTGLLAVVCAPLVGGSTARSWRVLRRDGAAHPSPNAGRCEAAFAGALGIRLGGRNVYAGRVEDRPVLGAEGRVCEPGDIERAVRLSLAVERAALVVCALGCLVVPGRRR